MARFVKALLLILGTIVGGDIGAVVLCFVLEVLDIRGVSTALFYVIWFVAGVFVGLFAYDWSGRQLCLVETGDWTGSPSAGKIGWTVLGMTALLLGAFLILLDKLAWLHGSSPDPYVPDNIPMTITFLVAISGSMIVGHTVLRPTKSG